MILSKSVIQVGLSDVFQTEAFTLGAAREKRKKIVGALTEWEMVCIYLDMDIAISNTRGPHDLGALEGVRRGVRQ